MENCLGRNASDLILVVFAAVVRWDQVHIPKETPAGPGPHAGILNKVKTVMDFKLTVAAVFVVRLL